MTCRSIVYTIKSTGTRYAWDETKRQANLDKHGFDFADAWRVFEAPGKLTVNVARQEEMRLQDIARVEAGVTTSLVYVERDATVRIISFRRANRKERRMFDDWTRSGV